MPKNFQKRLSKVLAIYDDSFVPFEYSDNFGRQFFHATTPEEVKYEDRLNPKAKFPKKS